MKWTGQFRGSEKDLRSPSPRSGWSVDLPRTQIESVRQRDDILSRLDVSRGTPKEHTQADGPHWNLPVREQSRNASAPCALRIVAATLGTPGRGTA